MAKQTSMRTSLGKVRGHGAGHGGTGHFIAQRTSAIALLLLGPWFVVSIALSAKTTYSGANPGYTSAIDFLTEPLNAIGTTLFVIAALYHMQIGMQEVIEDYIARPLTKALLLVLNALLCFALGAAAIFAVLYVNFGA